MAMGQKPNRGPSEHFEPTTKIGSEMGGAPKTPKWDPIGFENHSHVEIWRFSSRSQGAPHGAGASGEFEGSRGVGGFGHVHT